MHAPREGLAESVANINDALAKAHALLEKRCEFEFVISKVVSRDQLASILTSVLDRVARGEMPPATQKDRDHLVWSERYLNSV